MLIDATAEYIVDGDCIYSEVFVYDNVADVYHPEYIRTGVANLLYNGVSVSSVTFDKRFGNSDGGVKLYFNHPKHTKNLQLQISIVLEDDSAYTKTVPVLQNSMDDTIPLSQQPDTGELTEYRSVKRLDENI